jgi:hypothetical protein
VAVSMAVTAVATAEVVGWTLPLVAPAGMFTVAGTVTEDRLLVKAMLIPPVGAALEISIRQRIGLPPVTEDGSQAKKVMLGGSELPLPVPLPLPPLPLPLPLLPLPPLPLPPPPLPLPPPTLIDPEVADSTTGAPDGSAPATPPSVT